MTHLLMSSESIPKKDIGAAFEKMKVGNQETYCAIFDEKIAITLSAETNHEASMKARFWARERGMNWQILVTAKWQEDI